MAARPGFLFQWNKRDQADRAPARFNRALHVLRKTQASFLRDAVWKLIERAEKMPGVDSMPLDDFEPRRGE